MKPSVVAVRDLIAHITAFDDVERRHQADAVSWLESTDDVFRRVKPATPAKHLVSYVAVVDLDTSSYFLVDHRNAGLALPPGGHVEPDEHPARAAVRELHEELGLAARFSVVGSAPFFVTVTETVGVDHDHVDVSLWYVVAASRSAPLQLDLAEFAAARWWTHAEVMEAPGVPFDPHFRRFAAKLMSS